MESVDSEEKLNCGRRAKKESRGSCWMLFPRSEGAKEATGKGDRADLLEELRLLRLVCVGPELDPVNGFYVRRRKE